MFTRFVQLHMCLFAQKRKFVSPQSQKRTIARQIKSCQTLSSQNSAIGNKIRYFVVSKAKTLRYMRSKFIHHRLMEVVLRSTQKIHDLLFSALTDTDDVIGHQLKRKLRGKWKMASNSRYSNYNCSTITDLLGHTARNHK